MDDKKKTLYDALSTMYELGSYDDYTKKLNDDNKRRALYDAAKDTFELGDYDTFSRNLGYGDVAAPPKDDTKPARVNRDVSRLPENEIRIEPKQPETMVFDDEPNPVLKPAKKENRKTVSDAILGLATTPRTINYAAGNLINDTINKHDLTLEAQEQAWEEKNPVVESPDDNADMREQIKQQLGQLSDRVNGKLEDAVNQSYKEYQQKEEDIKKKGFFARLANEARYSADPLMYAQQQNEQMFGAKYNPELANKITTYKRAQSEIKKANDIIKEADMALNEGNYNKWQKSFLGGASRGLKTAFDPETWGEIDELQTNALYMKALDKAEAGKQLTEEEQDLLDAVATNMAVNAYFGSYLGSGYKAGQVTAESLPFMLEMAINPASRLGTSVASKTARYALRRFGNKTAAKAVGYAARAAGDIAGAAAMSATTGSIGVAADTMQRMADKGEDFWTAFGKSFDARTIENYSEMLGEYFEPILGATGQIARKGIDKLNLTRVNNFIDNVSTSKFIKGIDNFLDYTKWNGVLGEFAEEMAGGALNALMVGDQTLDTDQETGIFNAQNMLDTFLGVALMGGFVSTVKTGAFAIEKTRTNKEANIASAKANLVFGDDWSDTKQAIQDAVANNDTASLADIYEQNKDVPEKKAALLDYLKAYSQHVGAIKAYDKLMSDNLSTTAEMAQNTGFENGYTIDDAQEMNDAKNALDFAREKLKNTIGVEDITVEELNNEEDLPYTDEEKAIAFDYLQKKAVLEGIEQKVKDTIEQKVAAVDASIDEKTSDKGTLRPAATKSGEQVNIVSGEIIMQPGGKSVDKSQSSDSIVIVHEDGSKEMISPDEILTVSEETDPNEAKAAARAQIESEARNEQQAKINGLVTPAPGNQYSILGGDNMVHTATVVADESGSPLDPQGNVYIQIDGQPQTVSMPIAELQEMSDRESKARAKAAQDEIDAKKQTSDAPYQFNDIISVQTENGEIRGQINSGMVDGKYEVVFESPVKGKRVIEMTPQELDELKAQKIGAIEQPAQQETIPTQNDALTDTMPEEEAKQDLTGETLQEPETNSDEMPQEPQNALSKIPQDEEGNYMFEQAQYAQEGWDALLEYNDGSEQDAVEMATTMLSEKAKELKKAEQQKFGGKTPAEIKQSRNALKQRVEGLRREVDFWTQMSQYPQMLQRMSEENAKRQKRERLAEARRIQRQNGRYGKEDKVLGESYSFREFVMRNIANGAIRFKWANNPNNSRIKGLAAHLGLTGQRAEQQKRIWMLDGKEGLYPEAAAEELYQAYAESLGLDEVPNVSPMDALGIVLDVALSSATPRDMFNAAKELHYENDPQALEAERAEMEQAMADEEANFSNADTIDKAIANATASLNEDESELHVAAMESMAEQAPTEEFSRENYDYLFPNGRVDTPIGTIKLGEHQFEKLNRKGRQAQLGMMSKTLRDPDVILYEEDLAAPEDTERSGVLLFIKTFTKKDGDKYTNFESVTIRRDGEEIAISNHILGRNAYKGKLESDLVVYKKTSGISSERLLTKQDEPVPDLVPTQPDVLTDNKVSDISEENNNLPENPTVAEIQEARQEVNTEPTEGQKKAGNYKMGHIKLDGYDISLENPKGSVRKGVDENGNAWETEIKNDYGYLRGTEGVDGDHIDVFLSDTPEKGDVFVVDQVNPKTGEFDEHKVMYGFNSIDEARAAYLANYEEGWQGLGSITPVSKDEFKKWVASSHRKTKPFAEYASVKPLQTETPLTEVKESLATTQKPDTKEVDVEGLFNALKTNGEVRLSDFAKEPETEPQREESVPEKDETVPESTESVPKQPLGTIRTGKHTKTGEDLWIVTPADRVSKEEFTRLKTEAKKRGGYYSSFKPNNGFIFKTEEDANAFNKENAREASEPITLNEIESVVGASFDSVEGKTEPAKDGKPATKWKYDLYVGKDGNSSITRSNIGDGNSYPVGDARFNVTAKNPVELKEILENNGMSDILEEIGGMLDVHIDQWNFRQKANTEGFNGYKIGDKIIYNPNGGEKEYRGVVVNFTDYGDNLPIIDTGSGPVMYEVALLHQIRHAESKPETEQEQPKQEERPVNPSGNKLVTDERYAELRRRMLDKLKGQMNIGIDPEILAIGTEMAVYHIEKGARKFAEFAKAMIQDLSDTIRPYLKAFYNGARDLPEMSELSKEMTPYDDVSSFDVANFDKNTVDALASAETVVKEEDVAEQVEEAKERIKNTVKSSKSKKKSVSSQGESMGSLFSDVDEETKSKTTNTDNNELSTGSTSKNGGLGERKQQEVERSSGTGVVGNNHEDSATDQGRSAGLAERSPKQPTVKKNKTNNHVERGESYAPTTPAQRFSANVAAIRKMRELMDADRKATPEDMEILRKFTGWGGIGTYFNNEYSAENRELKSLLGDEEYQAAVMSANSAYYTPVNVIDAMWDAAKNLGFTGGTVLEGSAGIGNILASMPKKMSEASDITAVEIDSVTGNILKLLYPEADVYIKGFEETDIPNNSVDLAITNVPFITGLHVYDKVEKDLSRKFGDIHDFCIAKNVRKLKEGGIGIFITSKGTLDKSKALRSWVINEGDADFIGAFRLNNKTFIGTSVTSDIIIIRKRVNGKVSPNAIDVSGTTVTRRDTYSSMRYGEKDQPVAMEYNTYFVEHPEFMAGEMKFAFEKGETFRPTSTSLYPKEDTDQDKALAKWVKNLRNDAEKAQPTQEQSTATEQESTNNVKEGQLIVNSQGEICLSQRGKAVPIGVNSNKVKGQSKATVVKDYDAIKDALKEVLDYQVANESDEGLKPLLKKLNDVYDSFVKKYGQLNKNVAISFLRNDVDFATIAAIEDFTETETIDGKRKIEIKKTDVFSRRMVGYNTEPTPKTAKEGVIVSMNKFGHIDLEYIASKIGLPVEDVRKEIIESKLGYEDPQTGRIEVSYEYLSGNVREKLEYAKSQNKDGRYDSNIKALEKVIPYDIPAHLIEFSLGSDWLDKQLYIDFAREKYGLTDEFKIANIGGVWQVVGYGYFDQNNEKNRSAGVTSETVGKTAYGHELMICAMNNTPYTFSKTVKDRYTGETTTITDKNASQVATGRMAEIKDEFRDWCRDKMMNDTSLAEKVQKEYNDLFNAIVPKEVGEEFLPEHFEGSNLAIKLYPHQKKAVIRGTTEPLMLAHEVGSGKTFTLISTAMEMRRLGTAKKPMIVAQNATVGQFVSEAKKLYPNAKVLSLTEKDRSQEGRLAFYAKIKYNDWDLIIIPQSTFDLIPDSEERQQMFVQEKIDEKMYVLEQARMANADSNAIRRLEKELKDLETEYNTGVTVKSGKRDAKKEAEAKSNAAAKAKKQLDRKIDDVANFDDMGIDALLIDEAHEYKHLGFSTSIKRGVKGVDPSYSKKSAGVYLKTRAVFDKSGWKNVVFATGTPISNTAAEIWTFMKYLMPADVMKQNHIYYFDDFVRNFGKIAQSLEFATNGKFKENTRFGAYVNVPELVRIWSSVCDTVLTKDAEAASGTKLTDKLPAMEGGKAEDIFLPQSPSLIGIMRAVRKTLEEYEKLSGKEKKEQSHIPLTMYGIAKRAAIDPRLVDADAVDEPLSKTNRAVEEILKDLEATKEYKGTCAVFCDNYRRLEYDETGKKKEAFNLFQEIKRKLVEAGVPENQIVVMESGMSIEKKEKIFAQVNEGSVRVILGSTRTLGTGVNIQQRLHLLIHMDAPDRPMDYTQRNGRILRQGNLHKEWGKTVKVLRFGVEDSLDVTSYQRLKTKSSFIDSIMDGKPLLANGMEGRILEEEEEGLFDNPVAVLSGSQFALKKSQAERELRKYQGKLKQYQQDQIYIERQLKDNKNRISNYERFIKDYEASIALAKETFKDGKVKVVTVVGVPCRTEEEINTAIREKITKPLNAIKERARNSWGWNTTDYEYPLSFDGITVKVKVSVGRKEGMYVNGQMQKPSSFTIYSYTCPQLLNDIELSIPSTEGVKGIIEEFRKNLATGIYQQNAVNRLSTNIERMTSDNELMLQRRGVPFADQDKLDEAKARVDEYTKLMKEEMAEKEKKYADAQAIETNVDLSAIDVDDEDSAEDTNRYRSTAPSDVFTAEYPFKELRKQWIEDGEIYDAAEANDILQQLLVDFPDFEPAFARFIEMNEKNLEAFWETGGRDVEYKEEQLEDAFSAALDEEILNAVNPNFDNAERFRIREKEAPKETGIGYKVFKLKNGRLYPPMVDNPGGADTPVFLWLDADAAPVAAQSKTGRKKVKSSGSGTLAYRPGWHLGKIPYALQFNRGEKVDNPLGIRNLSGDLIKVGKYFPKDFVWAEVEYAADNNYQKEAMSYGYNENGKFQHSLAGLPEIPIDGYYEYRTNANPATDPWIITGAMRVKKILTPSEVDEIVKAAGREPQLRQPGAFTDAQIDKLNESLSSLSEDNAESKKKTALSLAKALGVNVNVIADREEITDSIRSRQRRKRNSKGWYDTLTQEIVVVLQNNVNNADVEATILHEIVGHKGMREIVGEENYNDFLEKVYRAADVELRKKITELAARKGWDFNLATEEYIASLAESGFKDRLERNLLEKIRDLFVDMFRRAKIAIGFHINDNDLRYMLWRSYKGRIKSALDLAEDINARMEMRVGDFAESNKNANFVDNERRGNQTNDNDRSQRGNGTGVAENNARRLGAKHTLGDTGVFEEELAAQRGRYSDADPTNNIEEQIGESIIDIAKRTGKFIPWEEAVSSGTKLNGNTKESICFVSDDLHKITKLKDPYAARATKGNSPFDIIEELILHNELFPETAYRLIGITQDRLGDMRFVLEQDYVKAELEADENDIADYLQKLGLKDEGRFIFGDERCAVLDAYGENVLVDENGKLRFIDPIIRIKQSPDYNLRYRSGEARDIYEEAVRIIDNKGKKSNTANLLNRLHEAYQDSMLSLKKLQEAVVAETGNTIEDNENAYMAENALSSKNKAEQDIYMNKFFKPLQDAIVKLIDIDNYTSYEDITRYIMAKHGLERNEYMARKLAHDKLKERYDEVERKYSEGDMHEERRIALEELKAEEDELYSKYIKKDYSGLSALTESEDSFNELAKDMVDTFEKYYPTDELWKRINDATRETLRKNYESGLISKESYENIKSMFKYYIPLRGWNEGEAADEYDYLNAGRPIFSPTIKVMKGRTSIADDPIATIGNMAQSAIALGNRNLMKQKFLNFAMNNKTSLLSVNKQWYVLNALGEWEENNPYIPEGASPEEAASIVDAFESTMKELERDGLAKTERDGLNLAKHATIAEGQEHAVKVRRAGKQYVVYINGNPRAAQALNGLTNPATADGKIIKVARTVKNFMARMFTSQNPAFIMTNLCRDLIWSATSVSLKENKEYRKHYNRILNNVLGKAKLVKLVRKFNNNSLDDSIPIERYFKEFIENGGETGYTQINTVDDFKRNMERVIKEAKNGVSIGTKAWRSIWDSIEYLNRCAEDTTRFSVYMTSRQIGRSIARSVKDAKDITVNFNKKGSGGYLAQYMNFAYIFFNATVQSLANVAGIARNNPKKFATTISTFMLTGAAIPLLSIVSDALVGGDDDDEAYWDLPEWVRRTNLVFKIPFTKNGFITIPLPHELRPFYGMGEIILSCIAGKESVEDGLYKAVESFSTMLPFDLTGNGGSMLVNFTPTIVQPIAQIISNTDYFGTPIYKKNDYNVLDPDWTKAYKGTSSILINGAKLLNDISGGNAVEKGYIDINPAIVEHLLESYFGGVGKTINRTVKTVSMVWDPDARLTRNVPIVSSFIQQTGERNENSQLNREYYDFLEDYRETEHKLSGYKKQIRMGAMEYADILSEFMETDEFKNYAAAKGYVNAISKINNALKYADDTTRTQLEEQMTYLKKELLK